MEFSENRDAQWSVKTPVTESRLRHAVGSMRLGLYEVWTTFAWPAGARYLA